MRNLWLSDPSYTLIPNKVLFLFLPSDWKNDTDERTHSLKRPFRCWHSLITAKNSTKMVSLSIISYHNHPDWLGVFLTAWLQYFQCKVCQVFLELSRKRAQGRQQSLSEADPPPPWQERPNNRPCQCLSQFGFPFVRSLLVRNIMCCKISSSKSTGNHNDFLPVVEGDCNWFSIKINPKRKSQFLHWPA